MANELNELDTTTVNNEGRQVHVINKVLPVEVSKGTIIFFDWVLWFLFIIPGIIFLIKKMNAKKELDQLQQKIQHHASQIDNFSEQRYNILENASRIVEKSINLDKEVMLSVAAYRSGAKSTNRNEMLNNLDNLGRQMALTFEAYPELKSQATIADAMQQNSYLQREITAARELYNDAVYQWNSSIFEWPTKKMVAAKNKYTTRIPFIASKEVREKVHYF
ncbi:LemA family protein [Mesomycoplasma neurolyticum]|uniref:LemA family n=1 Tax=Mesomycoplasma neurolyticum TaxID=2120 RepID=A0A449A4M8_9BACT|nr:LemA family protein [Mesomycoplasma neurolyticum]VEU59164.1 LemA family [Mesomycoplasma neurolyticum]